MGNTNGLTQALLDVQIPFDTDEPLSSHTSFCIGGAADVFCTPADTAQLARAVRLAKECGVPCFILGKGTNVLFGDRGFRGMVVSTLGALGHITAKEDTVAAGAGASLTDVCAAAQKSGLAGLEFAYGIPGSVGGAVFMNAGAYGGEIKNVLSEVLVLDEAFEQRRLPGDVLALEYRNSIFQHKPWCVLSATFRLQRGNAAEIAGLMRQHMQARKDKQPLELPSAGSAFKRPAGAYVGELIEKSGLRGFRIGGAAISEKHCGFIVNLGGATCADVLALAQHVETVVREKTGFALEREIRVVTQADSLF